jgi:excisionase family DNA binding protein
MENPFQVIIERLGSIESLLQQIQSGKENSNTEVHGIRKIMSLTEFCEYAGLSRQTVYKLTSAQKVPHSKRGKRLYFDKEKVDTWLLEHQVGQISDIAQKADEYLLRNQRRRK